VVETPDTALQRIRASRSAVAAARPAPVGTPAPTPPPSPAPTPTPAPSGTPVPISPVEKLRQVEQETQPAAPPIPAPTPYYVTALGKPSERAPFAFVPWQPADLVATQDELKQEIQLWEGAGGISRPRGSAGDVYDAYGNIFTVEKNMGALLEQVESYDPASVKDLRWASSGYTVNIASLNPRKAVIDAVNSIAKERPDDYTAYLASDAGLQDLFQRSQIALLTPPNFIEISAVNIKDWGPDLIHAHLPAGPLTNILANTVEVVGDPYFLAMGPVFPGATLAAKALVMGEMAVGMAAGEEGAEAVGAPPIAGQLVGGIALPSLAGLTRAGLRAVLERAASNPELGTPATELLRQKGAIVTGADEISRALGTEPRVLYRGTSTALGDQPLGEGAFLTPIKEDAQVYANTTAKIHGGEPQVITVEAAPDAIAPSEIPGLAADRGAVRVINPAGIRAIPEVPTVKTLGDVVVTFMGHDPSLKAFTPAVAQILERAGGSPGRLRIGLRTLLESGGETPSAQFVDDFAKSLEEVQRAGTLFGPAGAPAGALPAMAGGENLLTPELMNNMARSALERPEAQDLLRKTANILAEYIPGAKLLIEATNRMALAEDPHLAGAFRWVLNKQWQDAQREVALSSFRATKPPFIENEIGQIWLPEAVGSAKGSWIAVGDVFENVMRGESTYLPRLSVEQVSWIKRATGTLKQFTTEAEAATGMKIATREVYWPRFVKDPTAGRWSIQAGLTGRGRPPALFRRMFEEQQEAIAEHGLRYKPGVINQMDLYTQGMQRIARNGLVNAWWKEKGVIRIGAPTLKERPIGELGFGFRGVMNKEQLREVATVIGPTTRNPLITIPAKVNSVFRLLLTGTADTGWGAIQLMTMPFSPAGPGKWAEAMARGFYNMILNPRGFYEFVANSAAARRYAMYGGNLGLDTEFFEATKLLGTSGVPVVGPMWNVASYPLRAFVRRLEIGFETSLAYGRIFTFDAMADAARAPSLAARAAGAPAELAGEALHDELYRVARFTDTLIGQPRLEGVVSPTQMQFESAWVWFAARYTRSFLGTLSYVAGSGYTPAQARVILAKMLMGGAATISGLIAGVGTLQGHSQERILHDIAVALNPMSGKKHMAMNINGGWFGLGGTYRSGFAMFVGMADKDNWNYDNWEATTPGGVHLPNGLWDNPITRGWRSRGAPASTKLVDFLNGADYIGQEVDISAFADDPRKLLNYFTDNFTPISINAYLQGQGDWRVRLPRATAEFFGLRTSPETGGEAQTAIRNKISNQMYGMDYDQITNNRVARQRVNDSPEVVAVLEGYVRPMQQYRPESSWDKYIKQSEDVRANYGTQKEGLDDSARSGKLAGDDYRSRYSDLQRQEFGELTGLQTALGLTFEDKEAPPDSVDGALNAYFAVDLNAYTDPATQETDWEGFYADREAALVGLSDTDRADVDWYLSRHESELHRDFGKAFDEIIKPSGYLNARETVAQALKVDLPTLQKAAQQALLDRGARAGGADVWLVVDEILNQGLEAKLGEDAPTLSDLRNALREASPRLDVELYRQGYSDKVRTLAAVQMANDLKAQYPDRAYFTPPIVQNAKGASPTARTTTSGQSDQSVVAFLQAGRATHPDEAEVQSEYDLMIGAVASGQNLPEAIRLAESHLNAHINALRPEVMDTDRDPYPGHPEKNQEAAAGFTSVLALLKSKWVARPTE